MLFCEQCQQRISYEFKCVEGQSILKHIVVALARSSNVTSLIDEYIFSWHVYCVCTTSSDNSNIYRQQRFDVETLRIRATLQNGSWLELCQHEGLLQSKSALFLHSIRT